MTTALVPVKKASIRWEPKKWKPLYSQMILLSTMGEKGKKIACLFGYTEVQVSNILNSAQGKIIKGAITDKILTETQAEIPKQMNAAAVLAARRIRDLLENDSIAEKHPLAMADRALKVLSALGHIKGEGSSGNVQINKATFFSALSEEAADRIASALEKSKEASELHGKVGVEVVEGEYKTGH